MLSTGIWLVLGVGAAALIALVMMMLRTIRQSNHDAMAVGGLIFEGGNAVVFGLVIFVVLAKL